MSLTHPVPPSLLSTQGMGYGDLEMTTDSFGLRWQICRPSIDSSAGEREEVEIWPVSVDHLPSTEA
jgi:hypothetical protein